MTPNELSSSLYEVPGVAMSQLPIGGDVILISVQAVLSCTQCFRRSSQHENNDNAAAFFRHLRAILKLPSQLHHESNCLCD
jgi:hypothetical protein